MTKFKLIGAALALAIPTVAFAADAGCCGADKTCCKDGADCCKKDCCTDMKDGKHGDLAGHDMSGTPQK